jgi:endonuclease YncB( thermonuclease family)
MKPLTFIFLFLLSGVVNADISGTALIVDGDTIAISGMKVRLSGIDTPERKQTCRKSGVTWKCGYEATETLRGWTYTKEVRCIGDTKDRYGRLIADCFVDGYNVNARLVYEGWALAYRRYSKKYVPEEDQAKATKRGMWAGEFVAPWDWRRGERMKEVRIGSAPCKGGCATKD